MRAKTAQIRRGFSLIELVIVVVIIGIIAAIAIPRMSRGAEGAAESALIADLAVMRNAIDLYATEHTGDYPTLASFVNQMTQYTDDGGAVSATKDATHIYGPYLRKMPTLPIGDHKGDSGLAAPANVPPGVGDENATAGVGWLYDQASGQIWANEEDHFDK